MHDPTFNINPVFLAHSRLRRRRFDDTIQLSTSLLEKNQLDQQAWFLKIRALTLKSWIDDTELEEEGAGDLLLEDGSIQTAPRPGTSLARPLTQSSTSAALRPQTQSGRPITGFARPGTSSRRPTGTGTRGGTAQRVATALKWNRPGTARPTTASGRYIRLGTASLASQPGGPFIDIQRLNMEKYAERKHLARVLCDYILYCENNPKKTQGDGEDWWWLLRDGMSLYRMSLIQEAIQKYEKSRVQKQMDETALHLSKSYLRLDQPIVAASMFSDMSAMDPDNVTALVGEARIREALNDTEASITLYKQVLQVEASNIEAMACLAAHQFYSDQPEVALRFYRRLLLQGVANAELWNNLALCCYYASQFDLTLQCFQNALLMAGDEEQADIWYNVSHVALGIGDKNLAHQALNVAVSLNFAHAEAHNNLGVLEAQKGNSHAAVVEFKAAQDNGVALHEPRYNSALAAFKAGELENAHQRVLEALELFPEHSQSKELLPLIKGLLTIK